MKTVNNVTLMGSVAGDVTFSDFANGTNCVQLILKTRDFHGKGETRKVENSYHNLILWNSLGLKAKEILSKGDVIYVEGRLKTKRIEPKDSTSKPVYKTEVVVEDWTKVKDNTEVTQEDSE